MKNKIFTKAILSGMLLMGAANAATAAETETLLWQGSVAVGSWKNSVELPSRTYNVGDLIRVTATDLGTGAQGCFQVWGRTDDKYSLGKDYDYFDIHGNYELKITQEIIDFLSADGTPHIAMKGQNHTITKVTLVEGFVSDGTIWEGEVAMGNWKGSVKIAALPFADVVAGDRLIVEVTDVLAGAQGAISNGSWNPLQPEYEYFDIDDNFEITLTAEDVTTLKAGGVIIKGQLYTCVKVKIVSGSTGVEEVLVQKPITKVSNNVYALTNGSAPFAVYNLAGKVVKQGNDETIDITDLTSGIYILTTKGKSVKAQKK